MAMNEINEWIEDIGDIDFPIMLQRLSSRFYNWLENNRKQNKVSLVVLTMFKGISDHIQEKSIEVFKENTILRTKVEDRVEHNKILEDIAGKIAGTTGRLDTEENSGVKTSPTRRQEDHVVLVSKNEEEVDLSEVKTSIREVCNTDVDLPTPRDVLVTQRGQLILKMKNRIEAETLRDALNKEEPLKRKVRINVPVRRRQRILILSVDSELGEDVVSAAVTRALEESVADKGIVRGLSEKLKNPNLDGSTRNALAELYRETRLDFEIVRKTKTRQGATNWLIDVDNKGKDWLLAMKRICIDFNRYRVVNFINVTRCFKCQQFGHYAGACKGALRCANCSEEHNTSDCKSSIAKCINCYFDEDSTEVDHRADSPLCPAYQRYRDKLIPKAIPSRS